MSDEKYDIVLVGVGGQGLMLMSNAIGTACADKGLKVMTAENHGLAQRGGTTAVHLRIGSESFSPLIPFGMADLVVSLEPLEALRYIEFLKEGGTVLTNTRIQHPVPETVRVVEDRKEGAKPLELEPVLERIRKAAGEVIALDAFGLADAAGIPRAENVVLLGRISALAGFPLTAEELMTVVKRSVPPATIDANLAAFEAGRKSRGDVLNG